MSISFIKKTISEKSIITMAKKCAMFLEDKGRTCRKNAKDNSDYCHIVGHKAPAIVTAPAVPRQATPRSAAPATPTPAARALVLSDSSEDESEPEESPSPVAAPSFAASSDDTDNESELKYDPFASAMSDDSENVKMQEVANYYVYFAATEIELELLHKMREMSIKNALWKPEAMLSRLDEEEKLAKKLGCL